MPNYKNVDFNNGKIYVIISPNHDLFYYGSTVEELSVRYSKHNATNKSILHGNCTSKKIIDAGNAEIFEIEKYPCSSKEELEDREAFYILNDWDGCVNDRVPGAHRRAGGKNDYQKKRYLENKKEINKKQAVKHNCLLCGGRYTTSNKARHFNSKTHLKALQ